MLPVHARWGSIGLLAALCCLPWTLFAAPTAADEAVYQRYLEFGSLVQGGRLVPNWLPDGSSFWYAQGGPNDRRIIRADPATNTETPLFDVTRLRAKLGEALGHEPAGSGVPFERFQFDGPSQVRFVVEDVSYELDLQSYELSRALPLSTGSIALVRGEAERARAGSFFREQFRGVGKFSSPEAISPDGQWIASIEDDDLIMRATVDGQQVRFTDDGNALAFWDVEGALWRPWSPDSQRLAVFKQHTAGVARIPSIHWLKPLEEAQEILTLPAGGTLYRSELYLVDMNARRPVKVDLADTTNQYLRLLTWLPDGSELLLARYDRLLSRVDIQAVNATTGAVRHVMSEQSRTFLTNHHRALWSTDTGFTLLPDGSGFLWSSERSGWKHLYRYDIDGKLIRALTGGAWPVKDVVRIDRAGGWIYFTGHGDQTRPYDTHLYRVDLDGKRFSQLTQGKGQHTVDIAPAANYFTDTYSAVDVPPRTVLRKADGTLIRTLSEADISRLRVVGWVEPREYVVKAADGVTDLWVTLYLPYNFDPDRKYPVVEWIYAGPQDARRPMEFGDQQSRQSRLTFSRALANLGFVVLVLDGRGTPGRSKAFHDVVFGNWGQHEIADHAGAIRQLGARLGFMDLERVGVWGHSWGGHFAFRAMALAPELYKVGISSMPGFDSRRTTLFEPYLGMPQQHKAAYDAADALALAPKLQGDLLLIGGSNDTGTQADLFKMSERLIRLGKPHSMMIYPNTGHGAEGRTAEYDMELRKRFLVEHLMKISR